MKPWIAIALVMPLAVGLLALTRRPAAQLAAPVLVSAAPKVKDDAPEPEAAVPQNLELEDMNRRAIEREKAIERLEADYEERVEHLIESIDWTQAESRARFPVEVELIRAELNRAVKSCR